MVEMKYPIPEEMFNIPSRSTDRAFFVRIGRVDENTMKIELLENRKMITNTIYESQWTEKLTKVE